MASSRARRISGPGHNWAPNHVLRQMNRGLKMSDLHQLTFCVDLACWLLLSLSSYYTNSLVEQVVHIERLMPMDDSFEPPPSSSSSNPSGKDDDDDDDDNNASLVNHYHSPSPTGRKNLRRLGRRAAAAIAAEPPRVSENKSTLIALFLLYLCGCAMVGTAVGFVVAYCGLGGRCFSSSSEGY
jgi:hypothetical protein